MLGLGIFGVYGIVTRFPFATIVDEMGRIQTFVGSEIYLLMIFISVLYFFYIITSTNKMA